jgi:hypothetical protein
MDVEDESHREIHRSEVEDCPAAVKNQQEGFRPYLRIDFLMRDGDDNGRVHFCGPKDPRDLADAIRLLSSELLEILNSETIEFRDEDP